MTASPVASRMVAVSTKRKTCMLSCVQAFKASATKAASGSHYVEDSPPLTILLLCLTVVIMRTNNDKWLPHTDPPNP